MTRDDIIRMAREAGFVVNEKARQHQPNCIFHTQYMVDEQLERFAALVAAAERKACEKIQFELRERYISQNKTAQAEIMLLTAVYDYAAAIRARGQDPMPLFDDWGKDWK
jgi:hypothetical protein